MNRHKPGKIATNMMLISLLSVQDNIILAKWYKETAGLCFDCPEDRTCTYHLKLPTAISFYGWRYQAKHYCVCANALPCLFHLRAPPFTLQLKLLHPCVRFWEINYKNALQQVLCKLLFVYYLYSSAYFGKVTVEKLFI